MLDCFNFQAMFAVDHVQATKQSEISEEGAIVAIVKLLVNLMVIQIIPNNSKSKNMFYIRPS